MLHFNSVIILVFSLLYFTNAFAKVQVSTSSHRSRLNLNQQYSHQIHLNKILQKISQQGFSIFNDEALKSTDSSLEVLFLKIEKNQNFVKLSQDELNSLKFDQLTESVIHFLSRLNSSYHLPIHSKLRKEMQFKMFGLSQVIKKANEFSLTVQRHSFEKLHDMLLSQSVSLFYISMKESNRADLFFTSYYLRELDFPMDMTARYLEYLQKTKAWQQHNVFIAKIAQESFLGGSYLNKLNANHVDLLYQAGSLGKLNEDERLSLQKNYLKHLQYVGHHEKVKEIKKELASGILWQETKNVFFKPWTILKYIQFCVGYIFIAWPLEVILILVSVLIFGFQASTVLTADEKQKSSFGKKLWLMFTKAYMGSNVPFFSKVAASLVLFGVGLYFNSAKNFVESLITNL